MVTNKIGQPVTGSDFFDRERERRQIWDFLHRDHLLLLAARRVGKTSLMLRLREEAPEKGFAVAYASVADVEDEAGFTRRLLSAVAEAQGDTGRLDRLASGPLGKLLRRVKKVEAFSTGFELAPFDDSEWQSVGESLARALDRQQGRWLLLVDELPLFVLELVRKDPEGRRARRFLSWFRGLRQQADLTGSLRWLLAGSIGLDTVAARIRAGDTINDLHLIHLGPFTPELADRLLEELAASHEFPLADEVRTRMLRRVGWLIPYHLQLLFSKLRERCEDHGEPPTVTAVDDAIEALLRPAHKGYFDYWRQRLHEELGRPDGGFAIGLLGQAAPSEEGVSRETLSLALGKQVADADERAEKLRYLLDVLEGDGYLVEHEGRYRFQSPLLRVYWLRRVTP